MKYPLKFLAAVLKKTNDPLEIMTVDFRGPLLPGQVLVKVHYSGICGKQIEEIQATAGPDKFLPHMLGHEGSGVVVDFGPGVRKIKCGDKVVLHWMKGSGIDAELPSYFNNDQKINAGWVTTFNEYAVVSENRVTVLPEDADLSLACLLGCAVTTGFGVIVNEAKVPPGASVAVFGCGGVGLNVVQGAAFARAFPVIAVDRKQANLDLAAKLGATHLIDTTKNDVVSQVRAATAGRGAQFVMIAAAAPALAELAVESCSAPGQVYFIAVPPKDARISIDALSIHRCKSLTGSCGGGIVPDKDIPLYWDFYRRGCLDLKSLVGKTFSFEKINDAVSLVMAGYPGRCVVHFDPL